jgi:hypothetical protein
MPAEGRRSHGWGGAACATSGNGKPDAFERGRLVGIAEGKGTLDVTAPLRHTVLPGRKYTGLAKGVVIPIPRPAPPPPVSASGDVSSALG